jgi:hypothetical protein
MWLWIADVAWQQNDTDRAKKYYIAYYGTQTAPPPSRYAKRFADLGITTEVVAVAHADWLRKNGKLPSEDEDPQSSPDAPSTK